MAKYDFPLPEGRLFLNADGKVWRIVAQAQPVPETYLCEMEHTGQRAVLTHEWVSDYLSRTLPLVRRTEEDRQQRFVELAARAVHSEVQLAEIRKVLAQPVPPGKSITRDMNERLVRIRALAGEPTSEPVRAGTDDDGSGYVEETVEGGSALATEDEPRCPHDFPWGHHCVGRQPATTEDIARFLEGA